MLSVEGLVHPHDGDHVSIPEVGDVVCISWRDFDHLEFFGTDRVFKHLLGTHLTEPDYSVATDDEKLLMLAVVPVISFGDSGAGDVHGDLSAF